MHEKTGTGSSTKLVLGLIVARGELLSRVCAPPLPTARCMWIQAELSVKQSSL